MIRWANVDESLTEKRENNHPPLLSFLSLQYNIKKKEEPVEMVQEEPNPLMRKKKTPEELAAEAEQEDLDDFTSKLFNIKLNPFTSFFR